MSDVLSGDVFDLRDVIARFEELEDKITEGKHRSPTIEGTDEEVEYDTIKAFLEEVCGDGGDHQWRGDWYPVTFIADYHFEDYAQELAEDIGAIDKNLPWPANCIDWERAARELRADYGSVEIDGSTYWYR